MSQQGDLNFQSAEPAPSSGLGSLAQSAREKKLKQAKWILIILGVLMVLFNVAFMFIERDQVRKQLDDEIRKAGPNVIVDRAKLQQIEDAAVRLANLIHIGFGFAGIVILVCGIMVYQHPAACTVLGLVVYLGVIAIMAFIEPKTLIQGIILKVIIIAALVSAVQAAIAYQKEKDAAQAFAA